MQNEIEKGGNHSSTFELNINGKVFTTNTRNISGKEILELAQLTPVENYELLMKLTDREFEPVELNEKKDLSNPGIESFQAKPIRELTIYLDDEPKKVNVCFMTPIEILALDNLKPQQYYLKQIIGHQDITYKNDEHHKIAIVDNLRFSSCKKEPTPVS